MTTAPTKTSDDCGCDDGDEFAAVTAHDETATDTKPDPRGRKVTRWKGLLAPIGKPTGDKRRFAAGALTNRELPLPLKWQRMDNQGHSQSVVVGTIDKIEYAKDGEPWGEGLIFTPDPEQLPRLAEDVNEFKMLAKSGTLGPSVDLDDMEFTVDQQPEGEMSADAPGQAQQRPSIEVTKGRISATTMVPIAAFAETAPAFQMYEVDADDQASGVAPAVTASSVRNHGWRELPTAEVDWDAVGAVERLREWSAGDPEAYALGFLWHDGDEGLFPVADVVDGQLSLVPAALTAAADVIATGRCLLPEADKQALAEVLDDLGAGRAWEDFFGTATGGLIAAADFAQLPPADWFHDPQLDGPTAITVTPDGRVFGHLAEWGTCHTGMPGACVTPPKSRSQYAYFHTGEVLTEEGPVAVGRISLGGGHADTRLGFRAAAEHYDSTSTCVATVRAGQDKHGIWISGSLVPGVDEYKVAELRRSPLSGDWRRVGGQLELVHALAVNSGGFPVPRASMVAAALPEQPMVQQSLVAAGVIQVEESAESVDLGATVAAAVAQGIAEYRAGEQRRDVALGLLSAIDSNLAASAGVRDQQRALALLAKF